MNNTAENGQPPTDGPRTVQVRASEDGVEVETGDTGDIVLVPWSEAVKVGRQLIYLARERGDLDVTHGDKASGVRAHSRAS